ncbi:hypothetical protein Rleg10DRAFT_2888 [Rhizobium leguminosarum bv. trifolii WSM2012]|nr:hypothetical protein Rleg10DRAFT_2888 [Rhizobium leguminosarum bv. trifolii WSM2012]
MGGGMFLSGAAFSRSFDSGRWSSPLNYSSPLPANARIALLAVLHSLLFVIHQMKLLRCLRAEKFELLDQRRHPRSARDV